MKKSRLFLLLVATMAMGNAYANTVFSCTVQSGKKVQVTQNGNSVNYRFGKNLNNPEISLNVPVNRLKYNSHHHYGGAGGEVLGIPSGSYTYAVYEGVGEDGNEFAGLAVYKGGNYQSVADFSCRSGYTAYIGGLSNRAIHDEELPF